MPLKILTVFGTRPEAIKLAPVIYTLADDPRFESRVCVTAQHRQMLDQVLDFFEINPDFDLDLMRPDQTLSQITADVVTGMAEILRAAEPDVVIVQGDTTSAFAAALSAYYARTAVGHVEAGLRTWDKFSPFPEEMNRAMTGRLTDFHFAPTEGARRNLLSEGIAASTIWVTGNTVVDALLTTRDRVADWEASRVPGLEKGLDEGGRLVLITAHRRESFGEGMADICKAVAELAREHSDVEYVFPVHPNPNVRAPVGQILEGLANVHLIEPVEYPALVWLMSHSTLILTDSGGIQEEAPSLAVPVLVMREKTERPEGVEVGAVKLVGTDRGEIVSQANELLAGGPAYERMASAGNPYGDGHAAERIRDAMLDTLGARE
ncbi:MAG: UDP-N-acetylglucosamine 2-epimerase (non-hydrolyzing) [Dehalococcoidia bacterium]|nr:UDP-N-acetylglucosamine 2-epimerase (non-hydrolyzing) [Dehalococcoidia bacterium]